MLTICRHTGVLCMGGAWNEKEKRAIYSLVLRENLYKFFFIYEFEVMVISCTYWNILIFSIIILLIT
jgi:hypothetical protein